MPNNKNKYGLSRTIPNDVKKKIRSNSFFGCVICGHAIVDYEHVDPEFKDAKSHDPQRMTLLCPNCHRLVTNGVISKQLVLEKMKFPKSKRTGKTFHKFYLEKEAIIQIGSNIFKNLHIIRYNLIPILSIKASSDIEHPMKINATFFNSRNEILSEIKDNFWCANTDQHDILCNGKDFIIKDDKKDLLNVKRVSSKLVKINKLDMLINGWRVFLEDNTLSIHNYKKNITHSITDIIFEGKKENDTVCDIFTQGQFIFANRLDLSRRYNGKIKMVGETRGKVVIKWPD